MALCRWHFAGHLRSPIPQRSRRRCYACESLARCTPSKLGVGPAAESHGREGRVSLPGLGYRDRCSRCTAGRQCKVRGRVPKAQEDERPGAMLRCHSRCIAPRLHCATECPGPSHINFSRHCQIRAQDATKILPLIARFFGLPALRLTAHRKKRLGQVITESSCFCL